MAMTYLQLANIYNRLDQPMVRRAPRPPVCARGGRVWCEGDVEQQRMHRKLRADSYLRAERACKI